MSRRFLVALVFLLLAESIGWATGEHEHAIAQQIAGWTIIVGWVAGWLWDRRRARRGSIVLLVLLAACAGPPRPLTSAPSVATPWCFAVVVDVETVGEVNARACSEARWACDHGRDAALRVGRIAGIVAVGECGYE